MDVLKRTRLLLFFAFVIAALILLSPIASNNAIPNLYDYFNHIALIYNAKFALWHGQFPLRVAPLEQEGYGYPVFQFYSPTSYTISGLLLGILKFLNAYQVMKLTFGLAILFAGVYMYRLCLWLTNQHSVAFLSAIIFVFSPYYIILIDHLAAFNEMLAISLIPALLFYSISLCYEPKKFRSFLLVSFLWYCLLTMHLITSFYTGITLGLFFILIAYYEAKFKLLISLGMAYLLGTLLAMWYLGPIAILGKFLIVKKTFFYMHLYPLFLSQLFSPFGNIEVVHSAKVINVLAQIHPSLGAIAITVLILFFYYILNNEKLYDYKNRTKNIIIPANIMMILVICLIMMPGPLWNILPSIFSIGQYPWRLLSQVIWISNILIAVTLATLFKKGIEIKEMVIALLLILICASAWLSMPERNFTDISQFLKKPYLMYDNNNYLINDKFNNGKIIVNNEKTPSHEILAAKETTKFCHQSRNSIVCELPVMKQKIIELPFYYYPEMLSITQDGKPINYMGIKEKSKLLAAIEPRYKNTTVIQVKFTGLSWANFISIAAWAFYLTLIAYVLMKRYWVLNRIQVKPIFTS